MPARTPVPPSVTAVVKRRANASTTADDSTKRSPPDPVARNARIVTTSARSSAIGCRGRELVVADAVLVDELLEHGGIPLDFEVDGAAEPQDDVSHDADRIPALSRGWG